MTQQFFLIAQSRAQRGSNKTRLAFTFLLPIETDRQNNQVDTQQLIETSVNQNVSHR